MIRYLDEHKLSFHELNRVIKSWRRDWQNGRAYLNCRMGTSGCLNASIALQLYAMSYILSDWDLGFDCRTAISFGEDHDGFGQTYCQWKGFSCWSVLENHQGG